MNETFTCVKCGRDLPLSSFQPAKDRKSGHLPACRECMNAYTSMMRTRKRNENIDAARKKEREYHRRYKEKLAKENPQKLEELREKRRAYYRNHWRRQQISDHLPMWLELKIDYGENYLKNRLAP